MRMNKIDIRIYTNPVQFDLSVREYLEKSEPENGLLIGMIEHVKKNTPMETPVMIEARAADGVITAAFYNERNLIISRGSHEVWSTVASTIHDRRVRLPGVVGPALDSEQFAIEWSRQNSCEFHLAMDQRLYELRTVIWPEGIPGQARLISENDVDLLTAWLYGFYQDAIPWETPSIEQIRDNAKSRVPAQMTFFWVVHDKPVAMAALSRPSRRGYTVNAVYTPPEHRKHGYATALVAAISDVGLKRGKEFCVLFTDLSNPTSNAIYQKVGYKPFADSRNYRFDYTEKRST